MKIIKVILIGVTTLILIAILGIFIFVKTFDVQKYKPLIIKQATQSLGRLVNFDTAHLGITWKQGIHLQLNNLRIAEDPRFGKGDFLVIKKISLGLDIISLIQKKIKIPSIVIDTAQIQLVRNKDGVVNVSTIAQSLKTSYLNRDKVFAYFRNASEAISDNFGFFSRSYAIAQSIPPTLPDIQITNINIVNSALYFRDEFFSPTMNIEASKLNIEVRDFSINKPFWIRLVGSVFSDKENLKVQGIIGLDQQNSQIILRELRINTDLVDLSIDKLIKSLPLLKQVPLPTQLSAEVLINVQKMVISQRGLEDALVETNVNNGLLALRELSMPFKNVKLSAKITAKDIIVERFSSSFGEGFITAEAKIEDFLQKQKFETKLNIDKLQIQQLLPSQVLVKMEGIISGALTANALGFDPHLIKKTLSGQANLEIKQAKLKDINVLRSVLEQISIIPGLTEELENSLPERWKRKLAQKDTLFSDIQLPVNIEKGILVVPNVFLSADEFIFRGRIEASLQGAVTIIGEFLIPQDLSQLMVSRISPLQYLLNANGQIFIPLKVNTVVTNSKPTFYVDPEYIAKRLLVEQGKKQIFNLLDKTLSSKQESASDTANILEKSSSPASSQTQNQPTDDAQQTSDEETVKSLLRGIFGK